jgi:hypothetical protein
MAKANGALATKALANKLAKAHFYMLRARAKIISAKTV